MHYLRILALIIPGMLATAALAETRAEYIINAGLTSFDADDHEFDEIDGAFVSAGVVVPDQFLSVLDVPVSLSLGRLRLTDNGSTNDVTVWRLRGGLGYGNVMTDELSAYGRLEMEAVNVRADSSSDFVSAYPLASAGFHGVLAESPWRLGVIVSGREDDQGRTPVMGHLSLYTGQYDMGDWGIVIEGSDERIDVALSLRWN
ncbi:hypothetical protein E4656_10825 [Natronospirillum operosum]|uniref:Outer membrane protein beta-barrel domain-containing protein n=1 Tax=Natronospirillum operosum TaxID=2759953 RepID=A0A4Z0WGH6_9GAMM|nr:hypothetical protein [Natronospirillum operosum]TGG93530.1 hypothetical protein E4656_10825 [Natronospirillum operosum]